MMTTKHLKFRLKDADTIYNLAMDRFYKEDKQGFNIVIVKHENTFRVTCLPVRGKGKMGVFILFEYKDLLKLIRVHLERQIRKKEAIDVLHKEINRRMKKFKIVFDPQ